MGADLLVRGAVALARRARVPQLLVALTVVAIGTSLPELIVALQSVAAGYPGILLGNVVGSNIANVMVVGGLTAVVHPVAFGNASVRRDAAVMTLASFLFFALCPGGLGRSDGAVLLVGLMVVLGLTTNDALHAKRKAGPRTPIEWVLGLPSSLPLIVFFIGAGVVGLPVGARLVVHASVDLATRLGVPEAVVGLTIVAIGTSLPELATTLVAARQGRTEMVVGTIVGSNIFNLLAITGVAAVVSAVPLSVPGTFFVLDLPLMVFTALLVGVYVWARRRIGRLMGGALAIGYLAYVIVLYA
jgi:cation:H+ antiporter